VDDSDNVISAELGEVPVADVEIIKGDLCEQCGFKCIQGCT